MIADVSKTTRFTAPAWARWRRLIGLKYTQNWADVVHRALQMFEDSCITDGLLRPYNPHEELTPPTLFMVQGAELEQPEPKPTFVVFSRERCKRCKKDKLVNNDLLCETCQLVEESNGQLTTADRLPSTSPATSSPATSSPARPKKPAAPRPRKLQSAKIPNGKHTSKKPAAKKGGKS